MHPPEPVLEDDLDLDAMEEAGYRPGVVHGGIIYSINDRLNALTHFAHDPEFHVIIERYRMVAA